MYKLVTKYTWPNFRGSDLDGVKVIIPEKGFPTVSDTYRAVQPHKCTRDLQCRSLEVEGLHYLEKIRH